MYCGWAWYVETAAATGLPIRDVSFRGEFRRPTGPAADVCGFWVSPPCAIVYAIPEFIYGMSDNKDRNENDVEVLLQRRAQSDQGRAFSRRVRASVPSVPGRQRKGDQHKPEYLAINPNAKVPAIVDGDTLVFDSNAILLYLAEKTGTKARGELLSWLMFVASGVGPYSGQAVHFRNYACA